MISKRRSERSPILDVLPSRSLPPLERWTGVSPSQAAKSRPRRNVSAGGASAMRAAAVTVPMPGMVISRRAAAFSLACRAISLSSTATRSSNDLSSSTSTTRIDQYGQDRPSRLGQIGGGVLDGSHELGGMGRPFSSDHPELGQVTAQRVDGLRALANQQVPRAEHDGGGLLVRSLDGHKAHGRALGGLTDRFGISRVVLLSL